MLMKVLFTQACEDFAYNPSSSISFASKSNLILAYFSFSNIPFLSLLSNSVKPRLRVITKSSENCGLTCNLYVLLSPLSCSPSSAVTMELGAEFLLNSCGYMFIQYPDLLMMSHPSIGQIHNCPPSSYMSLEIDLVSKYCIHPDFQNATGFFDVLLWGQKWQECRNH